MLLIFYAHTAFAQVSISEIMYKPNPNSGHEWIEIKNIGSDATDFTYTTSKHWKLIQNTSSGGIKPYQGGNSLPSGGYAVLAVNPDTFLADHPDWNGVLFDITSLTSLNDTGATLTLVDTAGTTEDTVSYANTMGAAGDGNSLQKINDSWIASSPTPGIENSSTAIATTNATTPDSVSTTDLTPSVVSAASGLSSFPVEPQIFTSAGLRTRTVSAGATVTFSGRVWGLEKEPIENARMTWAFGDGGTTDGASVSHVYYYPGDYTVVLDAASGYYSASDSVRVVAVTPSIALRTGGDSARSFVAIENFGTTDLDLSGWQVSAPSKTFVLPKNTIIAAHKVLTLPSEISGLSTSTSTVVSLHFPNGTVVPTSETSLPTEVSSSSPVISREVAADSVVEGRVARAPQQSANVLATLDDEPSTDLSPAPQESSLWVWYIGAALLGALGALGIRFSRKPAEAPSPADDFEIIEEEDEDTKSL